MCRCSSCMNGPTKTQTFIHSQLRGVFSQPRKTGVQLPWLQIPKVKMLLQLFVRSSINSDEACLFHVLFVCQLAVSWRISTLLPVYIQMEPFWPTIIYDYLKEHEHRKSGNKSALLTKFTGSICFLCVPSDLSANWSLEWTLSVSSLTDTQCLVSVCVTTWITLREMCCIPSLDTMTPVGLNDDFSLFPQLELYGVHALTPTSGGKLPCDLMSQSQVNYCI